MVQTCNRVLFSQKKEEVLLHDTTRINLENIKLKERSQFQKATYYVTAFIKSA